MTHTLLTVIAASGEQVGRNIGNLLAGWARGLFLGIAAITCLVFLINRKHSELAVFIVAAIIVGGFVLAPGTVANTIEGIWKAITA